MSKRREEAERILRNNAALAFGCGVVPAPLLDVAALTLIEVRMLEQLAALYEVPFSRVRAEAYVSAFIGSLTSTHLGFGALRYALYTIPFAGPLLSAASLSTAGASITYAIGRFFIREFESGGSFIDLDLNRVHAQEIKEAPVTDAPLPAAAAEPENVASVDPPPVIALPEVQASNIGDEHPPVNAPASTALAPKTKAQDDLVIVLGIGPRIADLLVSKGIATFADLAATPVASLRSMLDEAGKGYSHHDPTTWPAQAQLLADGKTDELNAMWTELRRRP